MGGDGGKKRLRRMTGGESDSSRPHAKQLIFYESHDYYFIFVFILYIDDYILKYMYLWRERVIQLISFTDQIASATTYQHTARKQTPSNHIYTLSWEDPNGKISKQTSVRCRLPSHSQKPSQTRVRN